MADQHAFQTVRGTARCKVQTARRLMLKFVALGDSRRSTCGARGVRRSMNTATGIGRAASAVGDARGDRVVSRRPVGRQSGPRGF